MHAVPVRFHPQAVDDVVQAEEWYLDRSPSAASAFVREFELSLALVVETHEVWPDFEIGTKRYVLPKFPFSLIYKIHSGALVVIAVAHHKKRPGYWHSR